MSVWKFGTEAALKTTGQSGPRRAGRGPRVGALAKVLTSYAVSALFGLGAVQVERMSIASSTTRVGISSRIG